MVEKVHFLPAENFGGFCQEELGPEISDRLGLTESGCWPPWEDSVWYVVEDWQ